MSYASDAKLSDALRRLDTIEVRYRNISDELAALKMKLATVENLLVPRPNRNPRDKTENRSTKDSTWAQPTTP